MASQLPTAKMLDTLIDTSPSMREIGNLEPAQVAATGVRNTQGTVCDGIKFDLDIRVHYGAFVRSMGVPKLGIPKE